MNDSSAPAIVDIVTSQASDGESIAHLFDQSRRTKQLRRLLMGVVALVAIFLIWSIVARVDELAKARGNIEPAARVQLVQSLEGGQLSEILVSADDLVQQGQVLARFNDADFNRDLAQTDVKRDALLVDLERWTALAEGRNPDFSDINASPALISQAELLFAQEEALYEDQLQARLSAVERLQAQLEGANRMLPSLRGENEAAQNNLATMVDARDRGLINNMALTDAQQQAASAERALAQAESSLVELDAAIEGAQAELEATQETIAENAMTEASRITEQLGELDAEMSALGSRGDGREVVAPVTGFIKQLPDTRTGAVVPPGGTVAEIVPIEGGVVMRANLSPRDIGFVSVGQRALVKIDAYDFSRFGAMEGEVAAISPTTFRDPQTGAAYYRVDISLGGAYFRGDQSRVLLPGMSGEADIVTGNKSVFQFLMKPVFTNISTAFSER